MNAIGKKAAELLGAEITATGIVTATSKAASFLPYVALPWIIIVCLNMFI